MMKTRKILLILSFSTIVALSLFLCGFFPMKITLPGFASRKNITIANRFVTYPRPLYEKVVIVLIDALRSDFIMDRKGMQFVKGLQKAGLSRDFVLRAHPPTVTLPRIKAMTSGSIPGFVDVALNFDSRSFTEDNMISQAHRANRKLIFYGDDTWMKLFPDHFIRSEGTTSFFVTDYTEVDDNVTRHLDHELSAHDWDLMVLHYLGLDHIGHTVGPNSPLVGPKLREMDNIIKDIYTSLSKMREKSLVLVCGDHGMSDQGSHGGASEKEVLVPAVFLSPAFKPDRSVRRSGRDLFQIDLASTLSVLLGLPIPNNNLGQVLTGVLDGYSDLEVLDLLHINADQILHLLKQNVHGYLQESSYELYERAVTLLEAYDGNDTNGKPCFSDVLHGYEIAIDAMATRISISLTNYDMYTMIVGITMLIMCFINGCLLGLTRPQANLPLAYTYISVSVISLLAVFCHVTLCTSQSGSGSTLCGRSLISAAIVTTVLTCFQLLIAVGWTLLKNRQDHLEWYPQTVLQAFLLAGTVVHSLSFAASSFVEEEHQTWYFCVMTFFAISMVTSMRENVGRIFEKQDKGPCITRLDRDSGQCEYINHTGSSVPHEHLYENNAKDQSVLDGGTGKSNRRMQKKTLNENLEQYTHQYDQLPDMKTSVSDSEKTVDGFTLFSRCLGSAEVLGIVAVMVLGRCQRMINQTGNKWLDTPDVGDWLVRPENKPTLSLMVPASLLFIVGSRKPLLSIETMIFAAGLLGCYCYRIATGTINNIFHLTENFHFVSKGVTEARLVYLGIVTLWLYTGAKYIHLTRQQQQMKISKEKLHVQFLENIQTSWVMLITLLLRPHNTMLVAMFTIQERLLWKYVVKLHSLPFPYLALVCWWMGQAVFFQQGNSNSITTVDVSAGYVGLENYQPGLVGLLLYCSTYAGPVFWLLSMVKYIMATQLKAGPDNTSGKHVQRTHEGLFCCILTLGLERLLTLFLYTVLVTCQRYHLFVWTVFSPKLLYEGMLTLTWAIVSVTITLLL